MPCHSRSKVMEVDDDLSKHGVNVLFAFSARSRVEATPAALSREMALPGPSLSVSGSRRETSPK